MTDVDRRDAYIRLWIDGQLADDVVGRVRRIEVEERCDQATSFHVSLTTAPLATEDTVDWDAFADERFRLLHRVTIEISIGEQQDAPALEAVLVDGYITHVEAIFGADRVPGSSFELYGLDAMCLMHFDARQRTWPDIRAGARQTPPNDGSIVRSIFGEYGFATSQVEDTTPVRALDRASMVQRTTDAEFIRMLARRHGYEVYVERRSAPVQTGARFAGDVEAHFHLPRVDAEPQPELSLAPAHRPNLIELRASWESHRPTHVRSVHIDERTRRLRSSERDTSRLARMGPSTAVSRAQILETRLREILERRDLPPPGADPAADPPPVRALAFQQVDVPHDLTEVGTFAAADLDAVDWLAHARGVVQGLRYPAIIRARRPVMLAGAGETLDGKWYVRMTRHRWHWDRTQNAYEVDVELCRNVLNRVA